LKNACLRGVTKAFENLANTSEDFFQTVEEITQMETNIVNLRDAKWEKQAPLKVAETRLGNRHQRPNIEMCRDEPAHR